MQQADDKPSAILAGLVNSIRYKHQHNQSSFIESLNQTGQSFLFKSLLSVSSNSPTDRTDMSDYHDADDRDISSAIHNGAAINDEDYIDLLGFLSFLINRNKKEKNLLPILSQFLNVSSMLNDTFNPDRNRSNTQSITNLGESLSEDPVKVGLLQFLILVLVFLFFFFICKCNHMLESCRNRLDSSKRSSVNELDDSRYHDKKSLKHYCCFFWYEFKMRRRFKKRRLRNRRFGRNTASSSAQRRRKGITFDHNKTIRRNNSILKRRSMMTRNRVYSTVKFSGSTSSAHHHAERGTAQGEATGQPTDDKSESSPVQETTHLESGGTAPASSSRPNTHTPEDDLNNSQEIL